ncbi:hypothetical protein CLOM_g15144 [Closterium sp. NIES-68]|nr:hypothetical protein CLOM_g15144 [Closterium sp. NIES-68]GJP58989.1 hypothetical protein CLOP_g6748 [Closterium sp. NIES-67]
MESAGLSLPRCHTPSHTARLRNAHACLRSNAPSASFSLQPETKAALPRFKLQLVRDQSRCQRLSAVAVAASAESAANSASGVKVQITLVRECGFGQAFGVVGGAPELGQWEPARALQMEWSPGHVWSAQTVLPAGSQIEFKFIMVTEGGEVVWQPGPNKTAEISSAKGKLLLHLPWHNEELPPLPRTAEAGAAAAAAALAPEFQEAELASGNSAAKGAGEEKAEAVEANEPVEEEAVASAPAEGGSSQQAGGKAKQNAEEEEAREEAVGSVEQTSAQASPPEPDAREGTKQAGKPPPKKKPYSPTAQVLQADAAWGQRVWGSLISSWGRKSLMDEETDRQ